MPSADNHSPNVVYTLGHSNHPLEKFLELLALYKIELVVDTRSLPISSYSPQFNEQPLRASLRQHGVRYLFLGKELGGRPDGEEFYDAEGHVLYGKLAESPTFQAGVARVEREMPARRLALICSEENPAVCHRHLLVSRVLAARGTAVVHIRGDGRIQAEADLAAELAAQHRTDQLTLFDVAEEPAWRSIRSVLPRKTLPSSSEP